MRIRRLLTVSTIGLLAVAAVSCSGGSEVEKDLTTPEITPTTSAAPPTTSATTTTEAWTRKTLTITEEPEPEPGDFLTGLEQSDNPVVAVKIENTANGMPQYGISQADIVYTEQVEGGLVRLIAIFHSQLPEEVGAVRSIRSTDMQLLPSYGTPVLVSSGGNAAILNMQRNSPMTGIMEGASGFWRSPARYAPYNLHANVAQIAETYGDNAAPQYIGFDFAEKDLRTATARDVENISVTMRAATTAFSYNEGRYQAHFNGAPYTDAVDSAEVFVSNVIVQNTLNAPDGVIDPAGNPSYLTSTIGSGSFTLYRDGTAIDGTWNRDSANDPTIFADANGDPITLQPGKTWILLAPQGSNIAEG